MGALNPVVILNDFSSAQGGAGYLATTLANRLAALGFPVTFISGDAGHRDWTDGVTNVALGGTALLDGPKAVQAVRGLYNRAAAQQVRDWIARNDTPCTVYHLHNWSNIFSPAIFDALRDVAARCVIHAHDFFLACPNGTFLDYPKTQVCTRTPLSVSCITTQCDKRSYPQKLWRSARQQVLANRLRPHLKQARFIMVHPAMRTMLERAIKPKHLSVIRNPVTPFGPHVPAPQKQRGIAHIGQIQRLKGVYELAEAGRRLNLVIDFFGTGEDLDDLSATYPEHTYHGWSERSDIAAQLGRMRGVVIATQSPEPFCLAAFESRATGLPLIVSRAIIAERELTQSGAALPFEAGNVDSLCAALVAMIEDQKLVESMASAARASASEQTLSDWVDDHAKLYEQIVKKTAPQTEKEHSYALS